MIVMHCEVRNLYETKHEGKPVKRIQVESNGQPGKIDTYDLKDQTNHVFRKGDHVQLIVRPGMFEGKLYWSALGVLGASPAPGEPTRKGL